MSRPARPLGWLVISVAFGLVIASALSGGEPEQGRAPASKAPAKKLPGGIIISRETTFITGPLRKDGSVDYLAALNERYSRGVTPGNNAVAALLLAVGPSEVSESIRGEFFTMLGVGLMPEKGPYLEEFRTYFERKSPEPKSSAKEFGRIMDQPWSKADSPIGAAWLAENQMQIDLVVAATKRPHFYAPLIASGGAPETISALLPLMTTAREAARVLKIRAMHRIADGKPEEAWQDLLACHRLARLVDQGPTLVDGLVAIAIEGIAIPGDTILAHDGKLTAEQARRFAAEFRNLPPMAKMADRINWAERLLYLDCVATTACKGIGTIAALDDGSHSPKGPLASFAEQTLTGLVDWNETMRVGNQWYDRLVAAGSKPTRKARDAALADFERDLKKVAAEVKDIRVYFREIVSAGSLRAGMGRMVGRVFIALLMPAVSACVNAEDRVTGNESLVPVVFTLAAYRADHGGYPPDLAALVPKYLPALPKDPLGDGPLHYKRDGAGYLLYSVGRNGKDDGGRAYWDEPDVADGHDYDDIAIRVPAKKK